MWCIRGICSSYCFKTYPCTHLTVRTDTYMNEMTTTRSLQLPKIIALAHCAKYKCEYEYVKVGLHDQQTWSILTPNSVTRANILLRATGYAQLKRLQLAMLRRSLKHDRRQLVQACNELLHCCCNKKYWPCISVLTHWGRVTHICVGKTIIG